MARAKVKSMEINLDAPGGRGKPTLRLRITEAMFQQAGRSVSGAKNSINALVSRAQNGAQEAVGVALSTGFPGITSGGSQTLRYPRPGGGTAFMRTRSWDPLSRNYAKQKPASTVFWRKHPTPPGGYEDSSGGYRLTLQTLFKLNRLETQPGKSTPTKTTKGSKAGTKYRLLSWQVKFSTPQNALGDLISEPMVRGVGARGHRYPDGEEKFSPYAPRVNDISQMLWTEAQRPFVRNLAFSVGRGLGRDIEERLSETIKKIAAKSSKKGGKGSVSSAVLSVRP